MPFVAARNLLCRRYLRSTTIGGCTKLRTISTSKNGDSGLGLDSSPGEGLTLSPVAAKLRASYRVREFAELAGVSVKALHHYDRLDLLKPARTDAGYRVYSLADLARLE